MSYPVPVAPRPPDRNSGGHIAVAWVLTVVFPLAFLPWAIAATRHKQNTVTIALINALLGWTGVGWIIALVMACLPDPPQLQVTYVMQAPPPAIGPPPAVGRGPGQGWEPSGYVADGSMSDPGRSPLALPPAGHSTPYGASGYEQTPYSASPYSASPYSASPYGADPYQATPQHAFGMNSTDPSATFPQVAAPPPLSATDDDADPSTRDSADEPPYPPYRPGEPL